ncbi:hypothetical protein SAMN05519104_4392 [Rhizobiales bacterium GAS188]|nr:hypothetical protein SAMN05519104_4392 [Rhizobiales bacterium GAS188]
MNKPKSNVVKLRVPSKRKPAPRFDVAELGDRPRSIEARVHAFPRERHGRAVRQLAEQSAPWLVDENGGCRRDGGGPKRA